MAKKSVSRTKPEPNAAAPADAAPAAKPRPRARTKNTASNADPIVDSAASADTPAASATAAAPPIADDKTSVSMASEPSENDIRVRAYHRYLERGGGHGMDFDDWLQAKQDLTAKK
jgi:hypothetical protein